MDLPNFNDFFRIGATEALAANRKLSVEEVYRRGSNVNNIIAAAAAMADDCSAQIAAVRADNYLGSAKNEALDRKILDMYPDLPRKQAAPSLGYVTFYFTATSAFSIPEATVLSTADGTQFITTQLANISAGETSRRVPIRSLLAGSAQKADKNKIRNIITQIAGAPSDITCNNVAATFGGDDREQDDDYARRARSRFSAARRATVGAIEQAILEVPGVHRCTVVENLDAIGRPIGYVQAVVADRYTEQFVSTAVLPPAYSAQLSNLATQIHAQLEDWRAAGVGVSIVFAKVSIVSMNVSLAFTATADQEVVTEIVRAKLIQYVNSLRPGQTLTLEPLQRLIRSTSGVVYTGNELVTPTGDIVCRPQEVLRTSRLFVKVGG